MVVLKITGWSEIIFMLHFILMWSYPSPNAEGIVYIIQYIRLKRRNASGNAFRDSLSIFRALCFPSISAPLPPSFFPCPFSTAFTWI